MWVEEIELTLKTGMHGKDAARHKIKTHLLEEMETGNWNFWFQAVYGSCGL